MKDSQVTPAREETRFPSFQALNILFILLRFSLLIINQCPWLLCRAALPQRKTNKNFVQNLLGGFFITPAPLIPPSQGSLPGFPPKLTFKIGNIPEQPLWVHPRGLEQGNPSQPKISGVL